MRQLYIISIDHRSLSCVDRQQFVLDKTNRDILHAYMKYALGVYGAVLLSTCNRIEIYYEAELDISNQIIEKWSTLAKVENTELLKKIVTITGNESCIEYLLQLSAGIKSAIFGDDQILHQLKKAFETSRSKDSLSTLLERAYQCVMKFHKEVCNKTTFRNNSVSLAYHSLKSIYTHIPKASIKHKSMLVIGAGDMAAQIVKYLPKFSMGHVSIMNRTNSKAISLVKGTNVEVVPFEKVDCTNYDIVISCIDQGRNMLDHESNLAYYIDLSAYGSENRGLACPHILLGELQSVLSDSVKNRISSLSAIAFLLRSAAKSYLDWAGSWWQRNERNEIAA